MSFQQGLSGLNLSAKQLDTIGNNVANSGTIGFKQSQAQFADMYAASLSGAGSAQVGTGAKVAAIVQQFTQGNITNSSNPMDTAISGPGFFRMIDPSGSVLYSRNGQFQIDKNGYIVNNQGHKVSGYMPNAAGAITTGQPLPLQLNSADLQPKQTSNVVVGANLDSRTATPTNPVFNPLDALSFNNSTSLTVNDSLGANHIGTLYFQRQPIAPTTVPLAIPLGSTSATLASVVGMANGNTLTIAGAGVAGAPLTVTISGIVGNAVTFNPATLTATAAGAAVTSNAGSPAWAAYLTVDGVAVPVAGTPLTTLNFDTSGKLALPIGVVASAPFTPTGAAAQTLSFNFASTSQYGGSFGVSQLTQDGYTSGRLNGFNTGADGTILGRYSNGQSRPMGQMLLANFTNPQGLQPMGNNEWVESPTSGGPLIGTPGSSSLGIIQASAVEDSNVDLTAELVSMITAQRVYQANAQTIKTQDQVLQTLVNLR